MTVEEFMQLREVRNAPLELINGRIVDDCEPSCGPVIHEWVKSNLIQILAEWVRRNSSLKLFSGAPVQLDDSITAIPDIALFSGLTTEGIDSFHNTPALVVEVISSDGAAELETRISRYLKEGTNSVWAVFPETQSVWVYDPSGGARYFGGDQTLIGRAGLSDFSVPVSAIFEGI